MRTFFILSFLLCTWSYAFTQEAKFELKSAIIHKESTTLGQTIPIKWYFDDYGKKETIFTTVEMPPDMGGNKDLMVISEGLRITTVDLDEKVAHTSNLPEETINFLALTPDIRKKHAIRDAGEETILGKPCKIYIIERHDEDFDIETKVWVWKGIQLRMESGTGGMTIYSEITTQIEENPMIPASTFVIPADVEVL